MTLELTRAAGVDILQSLTQVQPPTTYNDFIFEIYWDADSSQYQTV